jgi:type I restriction enzyme M protein
LETVYDPAAGTAGFLVAAYEHIRLENSSANGRVAANLEGKTFERGFGDRLNAAQWRKLQTATFYGNDVDPKMVTLASMNLALRGLPDVRILKRNVLTSSFDRLRIPTQSGRGFRFEAGHRSDLIPATIPI